MDSRRLILLMIFVMSSFFLWENWQKQNHPQTVAANATSPANAGDAPKPSASLQAATSTAAPMPEQVGEVFTVKTDLLSAGISTQGGNLVELELVNYKQHENKEKNFVLFESKHQYLAQSGLIGKDMPDHRTVLKRVPGPTELAEGANELKIRLEAPTVDGVSISKVITFKRGSYLIDVAWEITNKGDKPFTAHAYYQLQRDDVKPEGETRMVSTFTGPAIYTDSEKYKKVDFSDIANEKAKFQKQADNGWLAMVQHYFVAAWVPQEKVMREFYMRKLAGSNTFQAGVIIPVNEIAPGKTETTKVDLYAGPQEQAALEKVAKGLELVVDYGWLTMVAVPIFWVLEVIHGLIGNWGWAIILLTIGLKAIFFPLSAASYKSMAKMKVLTPRLASLKERYADDRQRLNQEMMKLYQTEKVNPLGGCLPILIQIPVFIALYWVLLGAVEMRGAPWLGWITDLASPDPYFILPVLMIISMFVQTKLNPTPPDPIQAKVMMAMPLIFGVMFLWFPAGLVLYWVVNNILSIAQQWHITRQLEDGGKAANDAKVK